LGPQMVKMIPGIQTTIAWPLFVNINQKWANNAKNYQKWSEKAISGSQIWSKWSEMISSLVFQILSNLFHDTSHKSHSKYPKEIPWFQFYIFMILSLY
jgi:hypothetical protein